jgi:hypothetical protein
MTKNMSKATQTIRSIYFYAVSIIALFMLVFSAVDLINIGLKTWVFKNADPSYSICIPGNAGTYNGPMIPAPTDLNVKTAPIGPTQAQCDVQNKQNEENITRQNQSSAVRDFSMLIVALPLFLFHFRIVQKEWKERKEV